MLVCNILYKRHMFLHKITYFFFLFFLFKNSKMLARIFYICFKQLCNYRTYSFLLSGSMVKTESIVWWLSSNYWNYWHTWFSSSCDSIKYCICIFWRWNTNTFLLYTFYLFYDVILLFYNIISYNFYEILF